MIFSKQAYLLAAGSTILPDQLFTDSIINISGASKSLIFKNNEFKDLQFNAEAMDSELIVKINSSTLLFLGQSDLKDFSVEFRNQTR